MRSPTQPALTGDDIAGIVKTGLAAEVTDAAELTGGGLATVWRATLTDGRQVVVKVGPPASARLLAYEKGLIPTEARYFRLVGEKAPVPEVLAGSDDWIITTLLQGRPLTEADSPRARGGLGAAIARVHTITGDRFGDTGDRASGADWPTAFAEPRHHRPQRPRDHPAQRRAGGRGSAGAINRFGQTRRAIARKWSSRSS